MKLYILIVLLFISALNGCKAQSIKDIEDCQLVIKSENITLKAVKGYENLAVVRENNLNFNNSETKNNYIKDLKKFVYKHKTPYLEKNSGTTYIKNSFCDRVNKLSNNYSADLQEIKYKYINDLEALTLTLENKPNTSLNEVKAKNYTFTYPDNDCESQAEMFSRLSIDSDSNPALYKDAKKQYDICLEK